MSLAKERLFNYLQLRKWHPCLLIQAPNDEESKNLVVSNVQSIFCEKKDLRPCGHCEPCRKIASRLHPDFFWIEEGKLEPIKIETIRNLVSDLQLSPVSSGFRLAVIWQAEQLNGASANALLKSLEEPKPSRYYWLVSAHPRKLLPTIRSRSLSFSFRAHLKDSPETISLDEIKNEITSAKDKEDYQNISLKLQIYLRNQIKESQDKAQLKAFEDAVQLEYRLQSNANATLLVENFMRTYFP